MMKITMAAAAFAAAAGAQAGTPDDMTAEAQAIRAVHQQRELAIKQRLEMAWADVNDANAVKIEICGNNITFSAPYRWLKIMGNDLAKEIGCFALLEDTRGLVCMDATGTYRSTWVDPDTGVIVNHTVTPVYQYFHVIIQGPDGTTGEAVVNRADYATVDDLANAWHAAEKQGLSDTAHYWRMQEAE